MKHLHKIFNPLNKWSTQIEKKTGNHSFNENSVTIAAKYQPVTPKVTAVGQDISNKTVSSSFLGLSKPGSGIYFQKNKKIPSRNETMHYKNRIFTSAVLVVTLLYLTWHIYVVWIQPRKKQCCQCCTTNKIQRGDKDDREDEDENQFYDYLNTNLAHCTNDEDIQLQQHTSTRVSAEEHKIHFVDAPSRPIVGGHCAVHGIDVSVKKLCADEQDECRCYINRLANRAPCETSDLSREVVIEDSML